MKKQSALNWLVPLIAILAAVTASIGLFSTSGDGPFQFTTLHKETIEIYGRGLYRFDTPLIAIGYRVSDAFTLIAGIPLLLISFWLYRRGSLRGKILLTGTLLFFLYNFGSLAIGAAYNNLFLVYIILTMAAFLGGLGCFCHLIYRHFQNFFQNACRVAGFPFSLSFPASLSLVSGCS